VSFAACQLAVLLLTCELHLLLLLLQGVWAQPAQAGTDSEDDDDEGEAAGAASSSDDDGEAAAGSSDADEEAGSSSDDEQQQDHPAGNGHAAGSDSSDDEGPPEERSSKQQQQQRQQAFQKQAQPASKLAAAAAAGEDDNSEEGAELDPERVLLYERSKLRWYYAVVECDGRGTASRLYEACDGLEFERSACKFDLRWGGGAAGLWCVRGAQEGCSVCLWQLM
jgi:hypothetical protein